MRDAISSVVLIPALCVACTRPAAPPAPIGAAPCAVPGIGSVDSLWRQVRASGFTFCVPGDWRPTGHARGSTDAYRWTGGGTSLTWDIGPVPAEQGRAGDITGEVVYLGGTGGGTSAPVTAHVTAPAVKVTDDPCPPTTIPRTVDGVVLFVTHRACQGTWTTTAWSHAPAVYVQGTAHSGEAAKLLLSVMLTIRFALPTH